MSVPNLSGSIKGYNDKMFTSDRNIRKVFQMLGYGVNLRLHKVDEKIIRQFQLDFNKCSEKFGKWGKVEVTGKTDKDTLNALEIALRWAKKREREDGTPSATVWHSLCSVIENKDCDEDTCDAPRAYSQVDADGHSHKGDHDHHECNYVEVAPNGMAKLRNIHHDNALRAKVIDFEQHGPVIMAVVMIPPQADLPNGRPNPITCPCVFGCC